MHFVCLFALLCFDWSLSYVDTSRISWIVNLWAFPDSCLTAGPREDVIGKSAELSYANVQREWRCRKHKMERSREDLDWRMKRKEWICIKELFGRGQILNPEMEECLMKRMMFIMLYPNWVCACTFENHEWVSESIITQYVEEVIGMELDYEICIPCVM